MRATDLEVELRLALAPRVGESLRRHAARAFPDECCGFLLGRARERGGRSVDAVLPARNEAPAARGSRYLISPEEVLAARRRARELGLEVVGYYHSHPDGSAEPSGHDVEHAWPATSYLIVPVAGGAPGEPRSWRLREDRRGFVEEPIDPPEEGPEP